MSTSYRRDVSDKSKESMDLEKEDIWYPPVDDFDRCLDNEFDELEDTGLSESEFSYTTEEKALTTVVKNRFRAIVAVLLEESNLDWLETINTSAWQAGNFVEPCITIGSNMDPRAYLKIKRVASGNPNQSIFIKGIVCTQNISNEKMYTQQKNPKIMLLADSVKHETVAGQLASFNSLIPEEEDNIKKIKTQIESLRPDVLLVEKSLTSYIEQYLLSELYMNPKTV